MTETNEINLKNEGNKQSRDTGLHIEYFLSTDSQDTCLDILCVQTKYTFPLTSPLPSSVTLDIVVECVLFISMNTSTLIMYNI